MDIFGQIDLNDLYEFGFSIIGMFQFIHAFLFTTITVGEYEIVPYTWILGAGIGTLLLLSTVKKLTPFL